MKTRIVKIEYPNKKTWYQIQESRWPYWWWTPTMDDIPYATLEEAAADVWLYDGTKPKATVIYSN